VLERHLGHWRSLDVAVRDQVERDVDAAGAGGDVVGERVDGSLVEGVERRAVGLAASGADLLGDRVEGGLGAPARNTRAPSRANVLATALPIAPAPP
jgi:hypothetical protein